MKNRANAKLSTLTVLGLTMALLVPTRASWSWKDQDDYSQLAEDCTSKAEAAMKNISLMQSNPTQTQVQNFINVLRDQINTTCKPIPGSSYQINPGSCGRSSGDVLKNLGNLQATIAKTSNCEAQLNSVQNSLNGILDNCKSSNLKQ